jgi:hypothetical protein
MSNLAVIICIVVGAFFLGCINGYAIRDGAAKSAAAKAYKAAEGRRIVMQGQIDVLSAQYEEERRRVSSVNVQRTNTIKEFYRDAPAAPAVPANCALPDPMYSLLVNSVRDANVATGEPSLAVPKSAAPAATSH